MSEYDNEKWIDQLREKLNNYSEKVPDDVWDSLEKRYDRKVVPLWKKWQSIAAVLLLAIVSSSLVYIWNVLAPSDYIQHEKEKLVSAINNDNNGPHEIVKNQLSISHQKSIFNKVAIGERPKMNIAKDSVVGNKLDNQMPKEAIVDEDESKEKDEENADVRNEIHKKENKYAYNVQTHKKNKKWSVAISSSGVGISSTSNINGAMMRFSNTENNLIQSAPSEANGNCYLIDNYFANQIAVNPLKTRKKHYQPITFGLSFKFDIDNEWAVETGLTYTYLFSKLESGNVGNVIRQQQSLKYIGIPLKFSRNIFTMGNMNFYGVWGGEIEKCVSGKQKSFRQENGIEKLESIEKVDIQQLQLSLSASLGAEYMLIKKMSIYAEPGMVYYFDDKSGIETIRNEHPFNFNIKVGLKFTFTK